MYNVEFTIKNKDYWIKYYASCQGMKWSGWVNEANGKSVIERNEC